MKIGIISENGKIPLYFVKALIQLKCNRAISVILFNTPKEDNELRTPFLKIYKKIDGYISKNPQLEYSVTEFKKAFGENIGEFELSEIDKKEYFDIILAPSSHYHAYETFSKRGVWYFEFGKYEMMSGLYEMYSGKNEIEIKLKADKNSNYEIETLVEPVNIYSLASFTLQVYSKGAELLLSAFEKEVFSNISISERVHKTFTPSFLLMNIKVIFRITQRILDRLFYKYQWILLVKTQDIGTKVEEYSPLNTPNSVFQADPFIVEDNGKHWIFFEELNFIENKGYLCVGELIEGRKLSESVKILEKEQHLSYPNVFLYQGCYYMIPETSGNRTIELYRATQFPFQWEFVQVLIDDICAADTNVVFREDHIYLFTSIKNSEEGGFNDNLMIYYSKELFSTQWQAHQNNPVKMGALHSRCGGALFEKENQLYRVAQDCCGQYGRKMRVFSVKALTPSAYVEDFEYEIAPISKKYIGAHTLSINSKYVVIDGLRKKRNSVKDILNISMKAIKKVVK